jgi:hypothetical protein
MINLTSKGAVLKHARQVWKIAGDTILLDCARYFQKVTFSSTNACQRRDLLDGRQKCSMNKNK